MRLLLDLQIEVINKLSGYTIHNDKDELTNSEFIASIADKLILNLLLVSVVYLVMKIRYII